MKTKVKNQKWKKFMEEDATDVLFLFGFFILFLFVIWFALCAIYYEGILGISFIGGLILMAFTILGLHFNAFGLWISLALFISITGLYLAGSYSYLRDVIFLLLSFGTSFFLVHRFGFKEDDERHFYRQCTTGIRGFILFLVSILIFWTSCSLLDVVMENGRAANKLNPNRFSEIYADPSWRKPKKIGLALSGGGYRAALMHAGILNALENRHIPISVIGSISGGSIIGSFYTAGGNPDEFRRFLVERRFNLRRDLFDVHNAIRLMTPMEVPWTKIKLLPFWEFGRGDVQTNLLDRVLLKNLKMADLNKNNGPKLIIGATDLRSGNTIGISQNGLFVRPLVRPVDKDIFGNLRDKELHDPFKPKWLTELYTEKSQNQTNFLDLDSILESDLVQNHLRPKWTAWGFTDKKLGEQRVSTFVTASGAFPGAFDAVEWEPTPAHNFLLSDGGLSDNSGINLLLNANETDQKDYKSDIIISSDASAFFAPDHEIKSSLNQITRSVDVIYANTGVRVYKNDSERRPIILLSPLIFYPRNEILEVKDGAGITPRAEATNIFQFIPEYLIYKYESEPTDFGDLDLLISSLPDGKLKEAAAKELQDIKGNGFILDDVYYQNYGTGDSLRPRLEKLKKEIAILEKSPAKKKIGNEQTGQESESQDEFFLKNMRATLWLINQTVAITSTNHISEAFKSDLQVCLNVFIQTSTLDDQLSEDDVNALFRLGQYLVIFNSPAISYELSKANPQASEVELE
ncbi:MAG: patatin-like phospholipase family protein [Pyrinomonadaceae bacterium]